MKVAINNTRRKFIKNAVCLAGICAINPSQLFASTTSINYKLIPKLNISLPSIAMGTGITFEVGPSTGERANIKDVLARFSALGGTLLDTSCSYGTSEVVIGDLAHELSIQTKIFYATKVSTHGSGKEHGPIQFRDSLNRLRVNQIDLLQVHELRDWKDHLYLMDQLKQEQKIKYSGLTVALTSQHEDLFNILKKNKNIDFIQLNHSLMTRDAENKLLPLAQDLGVGVLVNRPFDGGQIFHKVSGQSLPEWSKDFNCTSWAEFFLKYIISHPAVTCPIPATDNLSHLIDNMQSGYGLLPTAKHRKLMIDFIKSV